MIDLLIMIKYTSAKMPIKSCACKAPYATGYCRHSKRLSRLNKQRALSVPVRNPFHLVFVRISPDGLSNKDQVLKPPKSCCVWNEWSLELNVTKVDYSRRTIITMIKDYLLAYRLSTYQKHLLKKDKKNTFPYSTTVVSFGSTKLFCLTTVSESTLVSP